MIHRNYSVRADFAAFDKMIRKRQEKEQINKAKIDGPMDPELRAAYDAAAQRSTAPVPAEKVAFDYEGFCKAIPEIMHHFAEVQARNAALRQKDPITPAEREQLQNGQAAEIQQRILEQRLDDITSGIRRDGESYEQAFVRATETPEGREVQQQLYELYRGYA